MGSSGELSHILHLFRRASFGLRPEELNVLKRYSLRQLVARLFSENAYEPLGEDYSWSGPPLNYETSEKRELKNGPGLSVKEANQHWIDRMASSPFTLHEKMTLFWHGFFACSAVRGDWTVYLNNTLRFQALGNFRTMLKAVSREPAMLSYLNNRQNKKGNPNENFARELMELFTLGAGNYTEKDIKEAARSFTGWTSDLAGNFRIETYSQDVGEKVVLGKSGSLTGDEVIDHLLSFRQCSRHVAGRVYEFFVSNSRNEEHIEEMAAVLYDSDYSISAMMKFLFSRNWFYSKEIVGKKIKSPSEWFVGLSRLFDLRVKKSSDLVALQTALGEVLFRPPNVAGWPGGRSWIDSSTLPLRLGFPYLLIPQERGSRKSNGLAAESLKFWQKKIEFESESFYNLIHEFSSEELLSVLIADPIAAQKFQDHHSRGRLLASLLTSLEFQLC